jgi:HK97 family phage portal protein
VKFPALKRYWQRALQGVTTASMTLAKASLRAQIVAGTPLANPEEWIIRWLFGGAPVTPTYVDEMSALRLTAYYGCIRVLSESVSTLPIGIYRGDEGQSAEEIDHPLTTLLNDQVNDVMTAVVGREVLQSHMVGWGNGFAEIEFNGAGQVQALWPIPPNRVRIERNGNRDVLFRITDFDNRSITLDKARVFHIPGLGFDGVKGYSPAAIARRTLGLSVGAEEFGVRFFENDARPGIALKHPAGLSDKAYNRLKATWQDEHGGVINAWRPRILEEGMDIAQIGLPNADMEFVNTRKFQLTEIARLFRVPPHLIMDLERGTYSNIEHQSLEFVKFTLRTHLFRWEQAINQKLLMGAEGIYAQHDVDDLLRGDFKTRMEGYGFAVQWGIKTRNQIRMIESDPPLPPDQRGDEIMVAQNMVFVTDIEKNRQLAMAGKAAGKDGAPPAEPVGAVPSKANGSARSVYGEKEHAQS